MGHEVKEEENKREKRGSGKGEEEILLPGNCYPSERRRKRASLAATPIAEGVGAGAGRVRR